MKYSTLTQAVWAAGTELGWGHAIAKHKMFCHWHGLSFRNLPYGFYDA